ncbi:LptF/LptG family permease [Candidatus Pelagibacter sp.]|nr:LptF/LptG family permease [Candidatus Pelagibacter sp.]
MFLINEKTIFRKFLAENTFFFLLTSLCVSFIIMVIQAVNNLDFVLEDGHSFLIYFYYTFLLYPKIIGKIMPLIFFTSLFYTLNKYENANELKIFWINGINKIRFYNVILKYTFLFFLMQLFLVSTISPYLQNKARNSFINSNLDFFPSLIQEKKFIDTVENLTIFIDKKISTNEYSNVFLKDDSTNNSKIIFAKKGFLIGNENNRTLRLLNGKFINIDYEGNNTYFNFDQTDFNLSKFGTKTITHQKIKETPLLNLINCIFYFSIKKNIYKYDIANCNNSSIKEISAEVYSRIFKPLNLFLLSSIVIFLLTTNYENKRFKLNQILIFSLGIISIIFFEIITNYSGNSNGNMLIFITLPIIIFLILYFIFYKKNTYKNTPT